MKQHIPSHPSQLILPPFHDKQQKTEPQLYQKSPWLPPAAFDKTTLAGAAPTVGDDKTTTPSSPYDATDPGLASPPSPPYWRFEPTRAELEAERTRLKTEWVAVHDQLSADFLAIGQECRTALHAVEADFCEYRRRQRDLAVAAAFSAGDGAGLWRRLGRYGRYGRERFRARFSEEYAEEARKRAERREEIVGRTAARFAAALDEFERRRVEVLDKLPWQLESFKGCPSRS